MERHMGKRRAEQAAAGLTSNGILLVNVLGLLDAAQIGRIRAQLPKKLLGADWFIGVAVSSAAEDQVLARIDDAAAEAVAKLGSTRGRTVRAKRSNT